MDTCNGCEKVWVISGSVSSWYINLKEWVQTSTGVSACTGITLTSGNIPTTSFNTCLDEYLKSGAGSRFVNSVIRDTNKTVISSVSSFELIKIEYGATEGVELMKNVRSIGNSSGLNVIVYNRAFLDYEQYSVFASETV
jgi:hypothetical protein